jgi:hypothetical protein
MSDWPRTCAEVEWQEDAPPMSKRLAGGKARGFKPLRRIQVYARNPSGANAMGAIESMATDSLNPTSRPRADDE